MQRTNRVQSGGRFDCARARRDSRAVGERREAEQRLVVREVRAAEVVQQRSGFGRRGYRRRGIERQREMLDGAWIVAARHLQSTEPAVNRDRFVDVARAVRRGGLEQNERALEPTVVAMTIRDL